MKAGSLAIVVFLASSLVACGGADAAGQGDELSGDESALTATRTAGAFQKLDGTDGRHVEGQLYQLLLRPDKTFFMRLKGEFGCGVFAGYTCPSSFLEGRTGDTIVRGAWSVTTSGVSLQPTGEGRPSAPVPMTMTFTGSTVKVEGRIVPNRRIFADLDVVALYGSRHSATDGNFAGTWKVTGPTDAEGFQPTLDGTNLFVGTEITHTLVFDGATKTYDETRSNSRSNSNSHDGDFSVAGATDGTGAGVLLLVKPGSFRAVPIVSIGATGLTLTVNSAPNPRALTATKER